MFIDKNFIYSISREVIEIRRHLHMYPELSGKEYQTSRYIKTTLESIGISSEIIGETGVVANLFINEAYPTVGIRAEIDALPIHEESNKNYCSKIEGVMHACSHDGITATVIGLAKLLLSYKQWLRCNIKFIFEPAEEIGIGAKKLIEEGVLENPKVDKIIIFHYVNNQPSGMVIQRNVSTAIVGKITILIKGKSCHWGDRESGIDAIAISADVISTINKINKNYLTKMPFTIGIGKINGGIAGNIMASSLELQGTLRAFEEDTFFDLYKHLKNALNEIASNNKTEIEVSLLSHIPSIINNPQLVILGDKVGRDIFGDKCYVSDDLYLAGDNAAYYFQKADGLRIVFFAERESEINHPLHSPKFDFDEEIFPLAISTLFNIISLIT